MATAQCLDFRTGTEKEDAKTYDNESSRITLSNLDKC